MARHGAFKADGTKRIVCAFGRANDNGLSSKPSGSRAPYRALCQGKSPFPNCCVAQPCAGLREKLRPLRMGWCDEILGFCDPSDGDAEVMSSHEELDARLDSLPVADLVRAWREVGTVDLRRQTSGTHAFAMYFDGLAQDNPERAVALIAAELDHEPDDEIVALLAEGKLLGQLLNVHALRVAGSLQELALRQPRLRWLMGRMAGSIAGGLVTNSEAKRRLLAIADEPAYRNWRDGRLSDDETIDFAALPLKELAAAWVEITARSDRDRERDRNWDALFDFQSELIGNDPLAALELVKAILAIETDQNVLGLLAAGMLEDLLPDENGPVIDAVVDEARRNPRFRDLLCGVWFYGMSPEVTERLEKARGEVPW